MNNVLIGLNKMLNLKNGTFNIRLSAMGGAGYRTVVYLSAGIHLREQTLI